MKGVKRSYKLFQAFRHEQTDPSTFYRMLADDTVKDVAQYCQLVGSTILDVGGASGYVADEFREVGSRSVTAEYSFDQMVEHGRRLVNGVAADGCALPIATASVDVCYSSNVLEHVVSPKRMLSEMVRVVTPGGVVYLTFTNWLSPWGGHETSPWHYRGGAWAANRYQRVHGIPPRNLYGESLFRLSVGEVLRWCEECPDVKVVDAFPRYYPRWAKPLVKVPGLRELLTWNLVVVMRRIDGVSEVQRDE
jgi:SAM-dependent methyltransferase